MLHAIKVASSPPLQAAHSQQNHSPYHNLDPTQPTQPHVLLGCSIVEGVLLAEEGPGGAAPFPLIQPVSFAAYPITTLTNPTLQPNIFLVRSMVDGGLLVEEEPGGAAATAAAAGGGGGGALGDEEREYLLADRQQRLVPELMEVGGARSDLEICGVI